MSHLKYKCKKPSEAYRYFISCGHKKIDKKIMLGSDLIECEVCFTQNETGIVEDFCMGKISNHLNCANKIVSGNDREEIKNLHFWYGTFMIMSSNAELSVSEDSQLTAQ